MVSIKERQIRFIAILSTRLFCELVTLLVNFDTTRLLLSNSKSDSKFAVFVDLSLY